MSRGCPFGRDGGAPEGLPEGLPGAAARAGWAGLEMGSDGEASGRMLAQQPGLGR